MPIKHGAARPEICFSKWGPIPDGHTVQLRVGQAGFYLDNDGIAAHEISINEFEVEPGVRFAGEQLSRIKEQDTGFALVWRKNWPNADRWDLLGCMAAAAQKRPGNASAGVNYSVQVTATYRDSSNVFFCSSADLIYTPQLDALSFSASKQNVAEPGNLDEEVALGGGWADTPEAEISKDAARTRDITSVENHRPGARHSALSQKDLGVHDAVGKDRFEALTNAEITRDRSLKKKLRDDFKLKTPDATKACLDRIRKGKGYLLSGEIKIKRSSR
jgi:hypothetical protein